MSIKTYQTLEVSRDGWSRQADLSSSQTRPSGLMIVQEVFKVPRQVSMDILNKPEFQVGGEHPDRPGFFAFPGAAFRGGAALSQVECTYYGIAPGRENKPHIERGKEKGTVVIRRMVSVQEAIPSQPGQSGKLARVSRYFGGRLRNAVCPTIRYIYVKKQSDNYKKFSHPRISSNTLEFDFGIPQPGLTRTVLESRAFWRPVDLQETTYGEFTEVTETFKFHYPV